MSTSHRAQTLIKRFWVTCSRRMATTPVVIPVIVIVVMPVMVMMVAVAITVVAC
jgi:hypothetical protein